MEEAAAGLAAAFSAQRVSPSLAAALRELLPGTSFCRAAVRCGSGLFVTEDLLHAGGNDVSVASLNNSLAGIAMGLNRPVVVAAPLSLTQLSAGHIICVPVAMPPAASGLVSRSEQLKQAAPRASPPPTTIEDVLNLSTRVRKALLERTPSATQPLCVGALLVAADSSCQRQGPSALLWERLCTLATASAPYFLVLSVSKAGDMAQILRQRAADCSSCDEDQLQDLPLSVCTTLLARTNTVSSASSSCSPPATPQAQPRQPNATQQLTQAAMQAAALVALSQQSGLAPPKVPDSPQAVEDEQDGSVSSTPLSDAQPASKGVPQDAPAPAPPLRASLGPAPLPTVWEESEDPKAALKQHRQLGFDAQADLKPQSQFRAPPSASLLRFVDPALEARFAATYNGGLLRSDALFAATHLAAIAAHTTMHPGDAFAGPALLAFAAALLAPLAVMVAGAHRYMRLREALLIVILLLHAVLLGHPGGPALPQLALPPGRLAWLMRATGAGPIAVSAVGFRLRFALFLPVQALCFALVTSSSISGLTGVEGITLPVVAAGLLLGKLLPALAVYCLEQRARLRFAHAAATAEAT